MLVTGGAGFIGCAVGRLLAESGRSVVAIDNLHPQVHARRERPAELHPSIELVVGDVTAATDWDALLTRVTPRAVIHLAAETGTGQSLTEATRHGMVNVVGTTAMTDALLRRDAVPERVLLTSSRAVYGEGRWQGSAGTFYPGVRSHEQLVAGHWDPTDPTGQPATPLPHRASETEPRPANIYAATKLAQEHILRSWCAAVGADLSVLRLQNVYGPGQSLTNSYTGIVALFAQMARRDEQIELYEDGEVIRDFVFIEDVATALMAALDAMPAMPGPYDIGQGRQSTIAELAQILAARHGAPAPRVSGKFRDGDVRAAWADTTDSADALGWSPQWPLEGGLAALDDWIAARTG